MSESTDPRDEERGHEPPPPGAFPPEPPPYGTPPAYGAPPPYGQPAYGQPAYGQPVYGQPGYGTQPIQTYLVWSILATFFCCLPAGIVSIVYASQVGTKQAMGDIAGALDSSRKARLWLFISVGVTLGIGVLYLVFVLIAFLAEGT